jgi:hypothetical protein
MTKRKPDVQVSGGSGMFFFTPLTNRALRWIDKHVSLEPWQWIGGAFAVEGRECAQPLMAAMKRSHLSVHR